MANTGQLEVKATFTIPFTQVQNTVIDSTLFENPIDKLIYISLLRFAFNKGEAFPSISTLAKMNSSSENRIRQSIKRLEKMELVTVITRRKSNKEHQSNLYHIHDLPKVHEEYSIMNLGKKTPEKKGTSKNEVPSSKSEVGGSSEIEVRGSKIEGEEEALNKKNLRIRNINKNQSIEGTEKARITENDIQKLNVHIAVQKQLILNIDRLIDDNIQIKDIEMNYLANKDNLNEYQYAEILSTVLRKTKSVIKNIPSLMNVSIKNYLSDIVEHKNKIEESKSNEVVPDWFKKRQKERQQTSYESDYSEYDFSMNNEPTDEDLFKNGF